MGSGVHFSRSLREVGFLADTLQCSASAPPNFLLPQVHSLIRTNTAFSRVGGEWPRLLILRALLTLWVPRPLAFFGKGGSRRRRRQVGLVTRLQPNQIAHAASPPTLAKNARMGHPHCERYTQELLRAGLSALNGERLWRIYPI
jgi:hypothetical protein